MGRSPRRESGSGGNLLRLGDDAVGNRRRVRQPEMHGRSLAFTPALRPELAAVKLGDATADIEPEAHTGKILTNGIAGATERLENGFGRTLGQTDAGIFDRDERAFLIRLHADSNEPAGGRVLDGVGEQVVDDLLQTGRIGV